jgi:two-component sensor histidine kinase
VAWRLDGAAEQGMVRLQWAETGVPPVTQPSRHGLGTSLIERSIVAQLGGTAAPDFRADGLHYEITFPCDGNVLLGANSRED